MTLTLTENKVRDRFPNRKARGEEFDEKVIVRGVDDFEMNDCEFTYDDAGGSNVKVLELDNCKNIRLINCHFPNKKKHLDVVFIHNDCKKITIKDCEFLGKEERGNFIDIKEGFDITIKHCTFKNQKFDGTNGGEAIIVGRGDDRDKSFDTHIIDCTFTNCNGDPELISIKQPKTEIVDNTFEGDSRWKRGNVSIRFGKDNTIKHNTFKGSGGGIVVRGSGNEIIDNDHIRNKTDNDDFRPLTLENGRDNEYARAVSNTIVDNTYTNCKGACIILGQERSPARKQAQFPKDNMFKNNTVIADDENSSFLLVPEYRGNEDRRKRIIRENRYENNSLRGKKAKPGPLELPAGAFENS